MATHYVGDVVVDIFKKTISLGEGGASILDKIECT
jgi:hypothetical protein